MKFIQILNNNEIICIIIAILNMYYYCRAILNYVCLNYFNEVEYFSITNEYNPVKTLFQQHITSITTSPEGISLNRLRLLKRYF